MLALGNPPVGAMTAIPEGKLKPVRSLRASRCGRHDYFYSRMQRTSPITPNDSTYFKVEWLVASRKITR